MLHSSHSLKNILLYSSIHPSIAVLCEDVSSSVHLSVHLLCVMCGYAWCVFLGLWAHQASLPVSFLIISLWRALSLILELTILARLAGQKVPNICLLLSLLPPVLGLQRHISSFLFTWIRDPNSGLHACAESHLPASLESPDSPRALGIMGAHHHALTHANITPAGVSVHLNFFKFSLNKLLFEKKFRNSPKYIFHKLESDSTLPFKWFL